MNTLDIIAIVICLGIVFLISVLIMMVIHFSTADIEIVKEDCYDRDWNKINELTCDVEIYCNGIPSFMDDDEC